jgi:translation elongation factor EF-1alpha
MSTESVNLPTRINIIEISPESANLSVAKVEYGYTKPGDVVFIYPTNIKAKITELFNMNMEEMSFA